MKNKTLPLLLTGGLLLTPITTLLAEPAYAATDVVTVSTPTPAPSGGTAEGSTLPGYVPPSQAPTATGVPPLPKPLPSTKGIAPAKPKPVVAPSASSSPAKTAPSSNSSQAPTTAASETPGVSGTPTTAPASASASAPAVGREQTQAPTTAPATTEAKSVNPVGLYVGVAALLGVLVCVGLLLVMRRRGKR